MMEAGGKSIVVSDASFFADARTLEICIFGLLALIALWLVSELFSLGIATLVENSGPLRHLQSDADLRRLLFARFGNRRQKMVSIVTERNEIANSLQSKRASLKRKLNKLKTEGDSIVRHVGENITGTNIYFFVVNNRYALSYAARGKHHPMLDESWKEGQVVEVWSKSPEQALAATYDRYPNNLGFQVKKLDDNDKLAGIEPAAPAETKVAYASA